jgi:hypothetical protein
MQRGKFIHNEPTKKEMDVALKRVAKNVKDIAMKNRGDIPKKKVEATIKRINKIIADDNKKNNYSAVKKAFKLALQNSSVK